MKIHGHTLESLAARCVEDGDCLIWQGATTTNGCPKVSVHGERRAVSARALWLALQGVELGARRAFSTCGNPLCLAHVAPRTRSQIAKATDALTGYTRNPVRRERIALAKRASNSPLTPEQVQDIRLGDGTLAQRAARHGVSAHTAWAIATGQRWRDYRNPLAGLAL